MNNNILKGMIMLNEELKLELMYSSPLETISLIKEYDKYIQEANEENKYAEGWFPVCISEFYNNEFQLIKNGETY